MVINILVACLVIKIFILNSQTFKYYFKVASIEIKSDYANVQTFFSFQNMYVVNFI